MSLMKMYHYHVTIYVLYYSHNNLVYPVKSTSDRSLGNENMSSVHYNISLR